MSADVATIPCPHFDPCEERRLSDEYQGGESKLGGGPGQMWHCKCDTFLVQINGLVHLTEKLNG